MTYGGFVKVCLGVAGAGAAVGLLVTSCTGRAGSVAIPEQRVNVVAPPPPPPPPTPQTATPATDPPMPAFPTPPPTDQGGGDQD